MKKNTFEYYFRNAGEKKLDNEIHTATYHGASKPELAIYLQNQVIISMLRHLEDDIQAFRDEMAELKIQDGKVENEPEQPPKKKGFTLICEDHEKAMQVSEQLAERLIFYGFVSLQEVYDLMSIPVVVGFDQNYVWRGLNGMEIKGNQVILPMED